MGIKGLEFSPGPGFLVLYLPAQSFLLTFYMNHLFLRQYTRLYWLFLLIWSQVPSLLFIRHQFSLWAMRPICRARVPGCHGRLSVSKPVLACCQDDKVTTLADPPPLICRARVPGCHGRLSVSKPVLACCHDDKVTTLVVYPPPLPLITC